MIVPILCVAVVCDRCGARAHENIGGAPELYADPDAAVVDATEAGWILVPPQAVCPQCVARAGCAVHGHLWGDWIPVAGLDGYTGQRRACILPTCPGEQHDPPRPGHADVTERHALARSL